MNGRTDMTGKVCLITGGNSGIGYVAARELAIAGAQVVLLCRNEGRGNAAREEIARVSGNERIGLIVADMAEMNQVQRAAEEFRSHHTRLDVLVNNAGGILQEHHVTAGGLEATFAGNYLGHALLTKLLLEPLKAAAPSRIINVSSVAHTLGRINFGDLQLERRYSGWRAYAQSKLAQILFTGELAAQLKGTGVTVNALHPGIVASAFTKGLTSGGFQKFMNAFYSLVSISSETGAQTIIYLAQSPEVATVTGGYFVQCKPRRASGAARNHKLRKRFWQETERLLADGALSGAKK